MEFLTNTRDDFKDNLHNSHPFQCCAFVLASPLQDGNKIPRWDLRVCIGAYVAQSPRLAGNVALILNPATGHISPQFHVVFGGSFSIKGISRRIRKSYTKHPKR